MPPSNSFAETVAVRCKAAKVAHQGVEPLPSIRQGFHGFIGCSYRCSMIVWDFCARCVFGVFVGEIC